MNRRIGILGTEQGPQVQVLAEALRQRKAEVVLIDPKRLTCFLPEGRTLYRRPDGGEIWLEELTGLIVRSLPGGSLEQVIYRVNALHFLEKRGLKLFNSASLLEKTVDKSYTSVLLAAAGLPVPRTIVTERLDQALEAVAGMGKTVVKPVFGSLGRGIVLLEDPDTAYRAFRALEMGRYVYYLQEFLPNANEDYRLFVIGDQVVGAMRRKADGWKTNIACGGSAEKYDPPPEIADLALKSAKLLQAEYLGVDILISRGQPYVIEANGIPGWAGLQTVTEKNIAALLADYVLEGIGNGS
ncbi:ATP-grasp domain-containing protein [Desulfosporosinus lacus]|uniref:Ribosomal protein S6--L-glutamate ligase n=1 Tax=Desulfosporosinus lacus DSM 15449 TaxID=1121420 RepID=A0A1M5V532_9FIRM|nr:RimK family alpha-L-glutamate ligase [Desulfosporosinus lacus]SHH70053.1 ribosomal protein S6--L-glutamate ligase [Desulfosporosinus lacus DSM 15449]